MCDSIQDDNNFASYPSKYIAWKSDILNYNIGNILGYIKQKRQQFPSVAYELILQTFKPLEHITNLYENIAYRIIVLRKYNKEINPMDEKQKILNDIEEAQRKLDEAHKKLDEYNTRYKRWKPEDGEYFHFITGDLEPQELIYREYKPTHRYYETYNCFKTYKEAQQEAEKILIRRQLEDIAKRLNKGKKIDWSDVEQFKYCFCLCGGNVDGASGKLITDFTRTKEQQGTVYCLDVNFLYVAKREIGEERLKKYIRGEG